MGLVEASDKLLATLGEYLAGEFENRQQSLEEPTWYVHLRVWQRPVPLFADSVTLFLEQASVAVNTPPYRQRLLRLRLQDNQLVGRYYGFREPQRFCGGGRAPAILTSLTQADVVDLPTCQVAIVATCLPGDGYRFSATMADGGLCHFEYGDHHGYVRLGFEVGPGAAQTPPTLEFLMQDKGIDPATGQATWGALMGPFRLIKQESYPLP